MRIRGLCDVFKSMKRPSFAGARRRGILANAEAEIAGSSRIGATHSERSTHAWPRPKPPRGTVQVLRKGRLPPNRMLITLQSKTKAGSAQKTKCGLRSLKAHWRKPGRFCSNVLGVLWGLSGTKTGTMKLLTTEATSKSHENPTRRVGGGHHLARPSLLTRELQ